MCTIYEQWPKIAKDAFFSDLEEIEFNEIDHIVFAGMGGSGTLGSIFSSILSKSNIHVSVVKGYLLPKTVDKNTLVVTTSISGNTIETLTALDSAKKLDCKIIAFSSGGKMEEICNQNNIEYRKIPLMHSPRASFTGFLYSMLKVLKQILSVPIEDITDSINELEKMKEQISIENLSLENPALKLAYSISGIPLIYYPAGLQAAAIRFKNCLNENSKIHAMVEDIVEACHNQVVAWENKSEIIPILVQGQDDFIKTKERWKIIKDFFHEKEIKFEEVYSINGNILTKLIGLIYLLDYSSIYLAILSSVDPTPIHSIEFIKTRVEKNHFKNF